MKINECCVCGCSFEARRKDTRYCGNACKNERVRNRYNSTVFEKPCKFCNTVFVGRGNESVCVDCKPTARKHVVLRKVEQQIACRKCGKILGTCIKNITRSTEILAITVCDECKEDVRLKSSERMKMNNPMSNKDTASKAAENTRRRWADPEYKEKMKERYSMAGLKRRGKPSNMSIENRIASSERMKKFNPMKIRKNVEKMIETSRANGSFDKIPKGENHWLWKGNRNRAQTIRSRLNKVWTSVIMARDDFTCQKCGCRGGRLEVHHSSVSFHDIVMGITGGTALELLTYDEFEEVSKKVVDAHENVEGITLCVDCHKIVDDKRR